MNSVLISLLTFIAVFGGALLGLALSRQLPTNHLSVETRTAVSVSMAVVGTLAALVISLMISTSNTAFSARTNAITTLAIDIVKLNRVLVRYGPDAAGIRDELRKYTETKALELSTDRDDDALSLDNLYMLETISDRVAELRPADDRMRQIQSRALQLIDDISDARWILVERTSVSTPPPFLILVIFWLSLLFASFGLFAPNNKTVIIILMLSAVAISGGIFMILELGSPTRGLIRASVSPLSDAIAEIEAR